MIKQKVGVFIPSEKTLFPMCLSISYVIFVCGKKVGVLLDALKIMLCTSYSLQKNTENSRLIFNPFETSNLSMNFMTITKEEW